MAMIDSAPVMKAMVVATNLHCPPQVGAQTNSGQFEGGANRSIIALSWRLV